MWELCNFITKICKHNLKLFLIFGLLSLSYERAEFSTCAVE